MDNVIFLSKHPHPHIHIYWACRFPLPDVIMIKYPRAVLRSFFFFLWFMTLNMAKCCERWRWI